MKKWILLIIKPETGNKILNLKSMKQRFGQAQKELSFILHERAKGFSVAQTLSRAAKPLSGGWFGYSCMAPGSDCSRGCSRQASKPRPCACSGTPAVVSSSPEIQCTLPMPKCFPQDFLWALLMQLHTHRFATAPASLFPMHGWQCSLPGMETAVWQ